MDDGLTDISRLRWRCRRGMLELDLLLQGFLEQRYGRLSPKQRNDFRALLELPDQTLFEYLMGFAEIEERELVDIVEKIRHTPVH